MNGNLTGRGYRIAFRWIAVLALFVSIHGMSGCACRRHCRDDFRCATFPCDPYYGHHPTCWRQWPEGWGCPVVFEEEVYLPSAGSMEIQDGAGQSVVPEEQAEDLSLPRPEENIVPDAEGAFNGPRNDLQFREGGRAYVSDPALNQGVTARAASTATVKKTRPRPFSKIGH